MSSKRNETIDAMKGLGIILVVMAHAMNTQIFPWRVIQNFHMPLFFFISGYLFCYNNDWKIYIVKKIKSLYIPFVIVNGLARLLTYFQTSINIFKELTKTLLLISPVSIFGATWFLKVLFVVSVSFYIIETIMNRILKKSKIAHLLLLGSIVICCFFVGSRTHFGHNISTCFTALAFYVCGYIFRNVSLQNLFYKMSDKLALIIMVFAMTVLFIVGYYCSASFTKNIYDSFSLTIVASFCGIYCTWIIGKYCKKVNLLVDIGKNSMTILIYQFLAFKIVSLLQIIVLRTEFQHINYFPYYLNSGIWYVLLVLCGVFLPYILTKGLQVIPNSKWLKYFGM